MGSSNNNRFWLASFPSVVLFSFLIWLHVAGLLQRHIRENKGGPMSKWTYWHTACPATYPHGSALHQNMTAKIETSQVGRPTEYSATPPHPLPQRCSKWCARTGFQGIASLISHLKGTNARCLEGVFQQKTAPQERVIKSPPMPGARLSQLRHPTCSLLVCSRAESCLTVVMISRYTSEPPKRGSFLAHCVCSCEGEKLYFAKKMGRFFLFFFPPTWTINISCHLNLWLWGLWMLENRLILLQQ